MKNTVGLVLVGLIILIGGVVAEGEEISLASDGQSKVVIIIPAGASSGEASASAELKKFLDQITGANFRVRKDNEKIAGSYISVGNTVQLREGGFAELPSTLGNEGIAVKLFGGNVFLLGGKRGIMNAVMAFLEEDLGCRWYSDKWEFIPKDENLKAAVTDRISIPDFDMRFVFSAHAMTNNAEWTRHNRVMKWNLFNHVKGWFCHTYTNICPMSEFKARPDLFAKRSNGTPFNTQICPTHPENIASAKKKVIAALKANTRKDASLIAIAENDGLTDYCHCKRCEKINKEHQTPIAAHLTLVNEVARAIAKDFPGFKVDFLVYSKDFRKPPVGMKMESNTAMWFCSNNVDKNANYRNNEIAVEQFDKWKELVNTVYIWEYGCDYSNYFRVVPSLPAKIDNLRFWKENGVDGIMFLEVFGARGGDQQALRAWILSKLLWNSKLDPDKLARDFCEGVFGDAAPEMYEYYQLVEQAGLAEKSIEKYYGEGEFIDRANKIFDKAFAKADKSGNTELRERIEVHYVPVAFMEIEAIFREYPDNKDNFPTKRYEWLLQQIKKITKREDMGSYSETRRMPGRIAELELLENAASSGVLGIHSTNGTLYQYPIRKDPLGTNGLATRLPCNDNWLVQWHFPVNLCVPGQRYQLRAQLRKENDAGVGHVATAGVHFPVTTSKSFTQKIRADQISSREYRWITIGKPFLPEKKNYIWFSAKAGSKIGGLFVNRIELIPIR